MEPRFIQTPSLVPDYTTAKFHDHVAVLKKKERKKERKNPQRLPSMSTGKNTNFSVGLTIPTLFVRSTSQYSSQVRHIFRHRYVIFFVKCTAAFEFSVSPCRILCHVPTG